MTQRIVFRIVLPMGRASHPISDKVSRKVSRLLRPWIAEALQYGAPLPLPFPAAAGFRGTAEQRPDGLVIHLSRVFQDRPAQSITVATIGVAARAAHLPSLCRHLSRLTGTVGPMPAGAPCCIVVPDVQRETQFPEMNEWLEEFADGVARAWLDMQEDGPITPARGGRDAAGAPGGRMAA